MHVESIVESIVEARAAGGERQTAPRLDRPAMDVSNTATRGSRRVGTPSDAPSPMATSGWDDAAAGAGADGAIKLRAKPTAAPRRRALRPPGTCAPTLVVRTQPRALGLGRGDLCSASPSARASPRSWTPPLVEEPPASPPAPRIRRHPRSPSSSSLAAPFLTTTCGRASSRTRTPPPTPYTSTPRPTSPSTPPDLLPDALRLFRRAIIPNPVASTAWGAASVVLAEKRLLARGITRPDRRAVRPPQRLVRPDTTLPARARSSPRHRPVVRGSSPDRHQRWPGAYDRARRRRIPSAAWRKGSQWFAMTRAPRERRRRRRTALPRVRAILRGERSVGEGDGACAVFGWVLRAGRTLRPGGVDVGWIGTRIRE